MTRASSCAHGGWSSRRLDEHNRGRPEPAPLVPLHQRTSAHSPLSLRKYSLTQTRLSSQAEPLLQLRPRASHPQSTEQHWDQSINRPNLQPAHTRSGRVYALLTAENAGATIPLASPDPRHGTTILYRSGSETCLYTPCTTSRPRQPSPRHPQLLTRHNPAVQSDNCLASRLPSRSG